VADFIETITAGHLTVTIRKNGRARRWRFLWEIADDSGAYEHGRAETYSDAFRAILTAAQALAADHRERASDIEKWASNG
jgi:hypothetical protein